MRQKLHSNVYKHETHLWHHQSESERIKANHNYQRLPKSRSSHGCQQIHDYYEDLHLSHINAAWEEKAESLQWVLVTSISTQSPSSTTHCWTRSCSFCTTCDVEVKDSAKKKNTISVTNKARHASHRSVITAVWSCDHSDAPRKPEDSTGSRSREVSNRQRGCFSPVVMLS